MSIRVGADLRAQAGDGHLLGLVPLRGAEFEQDTMGLGLNGSQIDHFIWHVVVALTTSGLCVTQ